MFIGQYTRENIMVQVRLRAMVNCGIMNQEFFIKTAVIYIKKTKQKNPPSNLSVPNWQNN